MSSKVHRIDAAYLAETSSVLEEDKYATYQAMQIAIGGFVLDVGCGPASDTLKLADCVGLDGLSVGIDSDLEMLREAARRSDGVEHVAHLQGDAAHLPFADAVFDAVRAERLFLHLTAPACALAETIRVAKRGARIVIFDTDWGTLSIDSPNDEIERTLCCLKSRTGLNNGFAGRTLLRMFCQQGLRNVGIEVRPKVLRDYRQVRRLAGMEDIESDALASGLIERPALAEWHRTLVEWSDRGEFFCTCNMVLAVGEKP